MLFIPFIVNITHSAIIKRKTTVKTENLISEGGGGVSEWKRA